MFVFGRDKNTGREVLFMRMPSVNAEGSRLDGFGVCPECHWLFTVNKTQIGNFDSDEPFVPFRVIFHVDGEGSFCPGSWQEPVDLTDMPKSSVSN